MIFFPKTSTLIIFNCIRINVAIWNLFFTILFLKRMNSLVYFSKLSKFQLTIFALKLTILTPVMYYIGLTAIKLIHLNTFRKLCRQC